MITLTVGTTYTTLSNVPIKLAQLLDDRLRYLSANATEDNTAYTSGRWDGFVRLYDRPLGRFPTGLLKRVKLILQQENIEFEVKTNLPPLPTDYNRNYQLQFPLRDYQHGAVETVLQQRRGILSMPTGSGKSECAWEIIQTVKPERVVFLVHSRVLLRQTVKRIKAAFPGETVYQWGDGKTPEAPYLAQYILVATVQSAFKDPSPLFKAATMVIVDESHHQSSDTFKKCTTACTQARYIIGLSATPFRADGADMELEAWLGPIIYKVEYDYLIDRGYLVPPEFHKVYDLEEALLMTTGMKTLIFSEKWNDIVAYQDTFTRFNVTMLNAKTPKIAQTIEAFAKGEITHIAATPMFDEGMDIPDIEAVVFFATCSSPVRAKQRIGRAMRPSPNKKKCLVIDLIDKHYSARLKGYKTEPAFSKRL